MKYNKLNIIDYLYSEGGAEHFGLHFIIHRTIMKPEDYELSNVDVNVHLGKPRTYKKKRSTFTNPCRDATYFMQVFGICPKGGGGLRGP